MFKQSFKCISNIYHYMKQKQSFFTRNELVTKQHINISSQLRHNCDVKPKLITWPWYNVRCLDKRHALDIKKKKRICLMMIWLWNTIALEPYTWTLKLIDILSMCCFIIFLMMHKAIRLMHVDLVLDWIKIMFWA